MNPRIVGAIAAALITGGVAIYFVASPAQQQIAPITTKQVVAYLAVQAGVFPAPGFCADTEVALWHDDLDGTSDSGPTAQQSAFAVCNLLGLDAGLDPVSVVAASCAAASHALCDAGSGSCVDQGTAACLAALAADGSYIGWVGPSYAATTQTDTVARIADRLAVHGGCAVQAVVGIDAGIGSCQYFPGAGEDASVRVPPLQTVTAAQHWSGGGCAPSPCVETAVRSAPGSLLSPQGTYGACTLNDLPYDGGSASSQCAAIPGKGVCAMFPGQTTAGICSACGSSNDCPLHHRCCAASSQSCFFPGYCAAGAAGPCPIASCL